MPDFSSLSVQDTVVSSDQLLIYSTVNGQPRRASMNAVLTYVDANIDATLAPIPLKSYLLSALPSAVANPYAVVYCLNGNVGQPCLAVSNGTVWKVSALGATVS